MKAFASFLIFIMITLVTPSTSHAYSVTKKQAVRINDTYTLYLISYAFGHEKQSFKLPTIATRGVGASTTDLEYTLKTPEGLTVKDGIAAAMIWSTAPQNNEQYHSTQGTSTTFTLAVLHAKSASTSRANTLTVTDLPFMIGTTVTRLAPHELAPYTISATGTTPLPMSNE